MFILVWKMRQQIEFQKSRSMVQALMAQQGAQDEHIKKAFEDLKESFFPFDKNQKAGELKKMRTVLDFWLKQGPVVVQKEVDPREQAKMASKLARGQRDLENKVAARKEGKTMDLDPFQKAKRRTRGAS